MPDAGSVWVDVLPDTKKFGPRLRAELKKHADKGMSVPVGLDSKAALAELERFEQQVDDLARRTAGIGVTVDSTSAVAKLAGIKRRVDALDGRVINLHVNTTGGIPAAPAAPRAAAPVATPRRPSGPQGSFTDISPAGSLAISTLVPPAIPAVGAAVGGVAGLLPGLTVGLTGLGATALAVVPGLMGIGKAMELQKKAADGSEEAMAAYREQLDSLTPSARDVMDELAELGGEFTRWHESLQPETMPVVARGIRLVKDNLDSLSPIVSESARGFDNLLESAEQGLAGPEWTRFIAFTTRQAEPTLTSLGRTVGNLTLGITGLAVSFEPLWNEMSQGLESTTADFAAWANEADNFTDFISWTIENGPMLLGVLGDVGEAAVDLGVALSPLGLVYAQGIGLLAQGISWLADNAPGLLQLAVAAGTAKVALDLLSRVNAGFIQPLRELPGRLRDYGEQIRNAGTAANGAAGGTSRFRNALGGVVGALGGPWGLAITAGVAALGLFAAAKANASDKVREYTDAIREDSGAIGENTRAHAIQALEEEGVLERAERLGVSLEQVTAATLGGATAQRQLNEELDRQSAALDDALQAREITEEQYAKDHRAIEALREAINGENTAIQEAVDAYGRKTEALGGSTDAMADAAWQARDLRTALDELTESNLSAASAELGFQMALDSATEAAATNGATLDLNTEAGQANRRELINLAEATHTQTVAMEENGASAGELIVQTRKAREEFIRVAREMGLTADEAEDLANEYLGIPGDVETEILVNATGKWSSVPVNSNMSPSNGQSQFYAEGGHVSGPGTATSDSIPAWLSDGEFVQPTHVVDHYGVGFMEALRHKQIPKDMFPGFARGGRVSAGKGDKPWSIVNDHRLDVREEWNRLVNLLIGEIGDDMADDFRRSASGPMGVVRLAEASLGKYPESNGNNTNAITRWFGMNGAPWCAMFISWLFAQTGASRALGGAARTAWTGDYYGSGMARTNSPQPGDVAVYGTRHVNLIASPGGGRRIGGNQGNNVTASPYSGGAIFRPMWDRVGFASGGLVSIADIVGQDREEDHRGGMSPLVKTIREISGYARGGVASGLAVVGEQGPELAYFADPARIYSNAESQRMLATAAKVTATSRGGDGASAPLVGAINASIHSADATVREMVAEITHSLHVVKTGGRFVDD